MGVAVTVRLFLSESDFHGVRFWFEPSLGVMRRVLWVVMFLCSATGLGYMIVHRVTYYYTYPTSSDLTTNNTHVPLPAIALCPPDGPLVPPAFVVRDLSDIHLALLLTEKYVIDINLLVEDDARSKFVTNKDLQKFAKALSRLRAENDSFSINTNVELIGVFAGLSHYFATEMVWAIIERVKNMDENLALPQTPGTEYLEYRKQIGMRKEYVDCWINLSINFIACSDYIRQEMVADTSCAVLDNFDGNQLYFNNLNAIGLVANYITISTLPELKWSNEYVPRVHFYDRREIPYHGYGTVQDTFLLGQPVTLTKVVSHEYLRIPYGNKPCIETTKTNCTKKCLAANSDCILYYFVDVAIRENTPRCKLFQQPLIQDQAALACIEHCSSTCSQTQFFTGTVRSSGKFTSSLDSNMFRLEPVRHLTHDVSVQVPLYLEGSLFAELGGTMGLFLGSSILTLYHCVEYTGVTLWRFLHL